MRILWIEDDPEITAELFFGKEILHSHDVLTIRDFEDAHKAIANNLEQFESELFDKAISKINLNQFKDKKVLIKGCNFKYIPFSAYVSISDMLLPVVNSLMYGEACSNVMIYKKKK